jgi:uncharacterized membrane protein
VPGTIPVADCTITNLPVPLPGPAGIVALVAGDVTGHYQVGAGYDTVDGKLLLIRWKDRIATVLDVPYGLSKGMPRAVNSKGVIVGDAQEEGTAPGRPMFAWVYRDGVLRKLPGLSGYDMAAAYGVNERGDIAGVAYTNPGFDGKNSVAIVWPADHPDRPRTLDAPSGAQPSGITDDGTVVGSLVTGWGRLREQDINSTPYVWSPNGHGHALTVPAGMTGGQVDRVRGKVAVGFLFGAGGTTPASWDLRTGDVRVFGNLRGSGAAVNAAGGIVVNTPVAAAVIARPDGTAVRLPRPAGAPDDLARAFWISADGRTVIGNASQRSGNMAPVIWQCRPW